MRRSLSSHPPVIPPLVRGRNPLGWAANALLLLVAALGGEWIVHQIQYRLIYGDRFGWVMGSTTHRYYMPQMGMALAAAALVLGGAVALVLLLYGLRRARLLAHVPRHAQRSVAPACPRPRWQALFPSALVLAWIQIAVYIGQENAETHAAGLPWPGLGVLFSSHYPVALPLHLLIALCISFVLWSLSLLVRRSRAAVRAARVLAALFLTTAAPLRRRTATYAYIPSRRPVAGPLGLRAPPLAA